MLPNTLINDQDSTENTAPKQRVLVLMAHPSIDRSEVNRPMAESISNLNGVSLVDLYAEYPDFQIDIDKEQQRLLSHDVIVFQHPLYWYSTPAILKEWQDLVLEYGFAYGINGTALQGKILLSAISAGGKKEAYHAEGYNHFSIRELLRPIEQTANLCGMIYLAPFALFGARTAVDESRIGQHIEEWILLLEALRDARVDLERARNVPYLNNNLDKIFKEA